MRADEPVRPRLGPRPDPPIGPAPFTTEWIISPPPPPPPRRPPTLPRWVPSERVLSALLVLLLVGSIALTNAVSGDAHRQAPATVTPAAVAAALDPTPTATAAEASGQLVPTGAATARPPVAPAVATAPTAGGQAASTTSDPPPANALLPKYRILAYYGHPGSSSMGILGEFNKDDLLAKLKDQAAAYEEADPTRPVMPAFELIASVAQPDPGNDGTYLLHTGPQILDEYADFTAQHGIQLILDVQIGRSSVADEIEAVRPWLERPNVQLALDPEFAMAEGEIPGNTIGGIDASDVAYAQRTLAKLAADKGLPPKILIVHQFFESMIRNRGELKPVPGVQLVIDVDGFGQPSDKTAVYNQFNGDGHVQFDGIKLFYKQDDPLMTPQDVLALRPAPDVVIYQ